MEKKLRLKDNNRIEQVVRKRNTVGDSFFVIYKGETKDTQKVAISVGKKYGNAVERNEAKRRIRGILRELNLAAVEILIVVKPTVKTLEYDVQKKHVTKLLKRHNLITE